MTTPETKSFTLADILTHTTGRLLTPIGDVYLFQRQAYLDLVQAVDDGIPHPVFRGRPA